VVGLGFVSVLAGPASDIAQWPGMHTSAELSAATMPVWLLVIPLGLTGHPGKTWRPGLTWHPPVGWMGQMAQGQLSATWGCSTVPWDG